MGPTALGVWKGGRFKGPPTPAKGGPDWWRASRPEVGRRREQLRSRGDKVDVYGGGNDATETLKLPGNGLP